MIPWNELPDRVNGDPEFRLEEAALDAEADLVVDLGDGAAAAARPALRGVVFGRRVVRWVIAVAAIFVMANVLGQRRLRPETPVPSPLANMTAEAD